MNGQEFVRIFETLYPKNLAYDWDNVGLQIGTMNKDINKALISLDLTSDVIDEAIHNKVDLILVHHPLIFAPIKSINSDTVIGKAITRLIKNDITLYVAHTNFDISNYGMNKILADKLNLKNQRLLDEITEDEGLGIVGEVDSIKLKDYIKIVKETFNLDHVLLIGNEEDTIKNVAISGGSGSSNIMNAKRKNADLYISGDLTYHHAINCRELKLNALDVGHNIEKFFMPKLKEILIKQGINIELIVSEIDTNPYKIK